MLLPTVPVNVLDHDSFAVGPNREFAKIVLDQKDSCLRRVEVVSPFVTFTGLAAHNSLTSDAVWKISRTTIAGLETITEFASESFDQIWDNRLALFGPPETAAFTNTKSTYFDGINDYINFGNQLNYESNIPFSYSFWIRSSNLGNNQILFSKFLTNKGIILKIVAGKLDFQMQSGTAKLLHITSTNVVIPILSWHHVVVSTTGSRLASECKMYVDGLSVSFVTTSDTLDADSILNSTPAQFGAYTNNSQYYEGYIDEVSFYEGVLTALEVTELYNAGEPTALTEFSNQPILIHWWRMGDFGSDEYPRIYDQVDGIDGSMINMVNFNFQEVVP